MNGEMEVRTDGKRPGFFQIDNHVLDKYARTVGFTAWAIYTTLWRHAWGQKVSKVTVAEIAALWGCGYRTVIRARKRLETLSLIRIQKRLGKPAEVTLLTISQLDFADKLLSAEVPPMAHSTRPAVTLPKAPTAAREGGHQRHQVEATNGTRTSKTLKTLKTAPERGSFKTSATPPDPGKPHRLTPAERATMDYKAVRKELNAMNGANIGGRDEDWNRMLRTACHRAGVTLARWNEIQEQFQ